MFRKLPPSSFPLPPIRSPLTLSEHHLVHLQLDLVEIDFTAVSCAVDSLYEPTPLERFCNWSPVCLRVTVFVALLVFLDVVATVCTGGIGRLAFFASMVSTCRYSASRLSASLSVLPEWRTLGKPALDFGITLIEFGAGDALGLVVLKGGLNFAL